MKKLLVIVMIVMLCSGVYADYDYQKTKVDVYVDDMLMDTFDDEQGIDLPAFIYNNRTMLPLKKTFSLFGISSSQVVWHGEDRSILVTTNDLDIIWMQIDNHNMLINGESVYSDVAPKVFDNRTFVPLAIISKLLGETPIWHGETRHVTMTPSTYLLNENQLVIDRQLGFSNPVYLSDFKHYLVQKYNLVSREVEKSFTVKFNPKAFEFVFNQVLEEQHLSSEDFKITSDNLYYRNDGRDGIYVIGAINNKTIEFNASNMTINEIQNIFKATKEVK